MDNGLCRIALLQTAVGRDVYENISKAEQKIEQAAYQGAQIICLPELFFTRYFPQHIGLPINDFCKPLNDPVIGQFRTLAQNIHAVLIIPFCETGEDGRIYNSAVVIDADGTLFPPYHKIHIPQDPLFYEKEYFIPGDTYRVFKTRYAEIAVLICYDQWFPEAARTVSLMGAEIIFYPTAIGHIRGEIPGEGDWKTSWQIIQRSHAIANSVPVAAVNRCGWEDELFFFGGSFICDAFGTLIAEAGDQEQILLADIDLEMGPSIRKGWGFFRNRRIDTYSPLLSKSISDEKMSSVLTPGNQGYHMPAEWEKHDAVWMSWPHNDLTFPHLEEVEEIYLNLLDAFSQSERVELLVRDYAMQEKIRHFLDMRGIDPSFITYHIVPYSDVWIRDYGPSFLVNRALRSVTAVSWEFNAWGDKYDELIPDGRITRELILDHGIHLFLPGIILEGGSIDVNGRGTVVTTRECLLNPNRNPTLTQDEIEEYLRSYLSIKKVIWLNKGIAGDDSDGHVDDIARFVNETTIVCTLEDNPDDENYSLLQENYQILLNSTDQDNRPFTIIPIPMPNPVFDNENRYPASYLNFYISNTIVVVPVFSDLRDKKALTILQSLFPDRKVIGIQARAMVEGFGTFHCATQQQPGV